MAMVPNTLSTAASSPRSLRQAFEQPAGVGVGVVERHGRDAGFHGAQRTVTRHDAMAGARRATTSSPYFADNASEVGLPYPGPPTVERDRGRGRARPVAERAALGRRSARARAAPRRRAERAHVGHGRARPRPPAARDRPARPRPLRLADRPRLLAGGERAVGRDGGGAGRARRGRGRRHVARRPHRARAERAGAGARPQARARRRHARA